MFCARCCRIDQAGICLNEASFQSYRPLFLTKERSGLKIQRNASLIADSLALCPDSPAILVMTDFLDHIPNVWCLADVNKSKIDMWDLSVSQAARVLFSETKERPCIFICDLPERRVLGIVTPKDISLERLLAVAASGGEKPECLPVGPFIQSIDNVPLISMDSVIASRVGDIMATFDAVDGDLILVGDIDFSSGEKVIRGLFARHLIREKITDASVKGADECCSGLL